MKQNYLYQVIANGWPEVATSLHEAASLAGVKGLENNDDEWIIIKFFGNLENYQVMQDKSRWTVQWGTSFITRYPNKAQPNMTSGPGIKALLNENGDLIKLVMGLDKAFVLSTHSMDRMEERSYYGPKNLLKRLVDTPEDKFIYKEDNNTKGDTYEVDIPALVVRLSKVGQKKYIILTVIPNVI